MRPGRVPISPARPWHGGLPRGGADDETLIDADLYPLVRRFVLDHEREQARKQVHKAQEPRQGHPLVPALSGGE